MESARCPDVRYCSAESLETRRYSLESCVAFSNFLSDSVSSAQGIFGKADSLQILAAGEQFQDGPRKHAAYFTSSMWTSWGSMQRNIRPRPTWGGNGRMAIMPCALLCTCYQWFYRNTDYNQDIIILSPVSSKPETYLPLFCRER